MKQNEVHDEQIIVAKLWQEKFKRQESSTFMNKKNDLFLWTAMEINLAMYTVYEWQSIRLLIYRFSQS